MTVVCIVQARMESSRLPGKVLEPIGGQPMLGKVISRLQRSRLLDDVVIATTTSTANDVLEVVAGEFGVQCTRGASFDVLDRYQQAAGRFPRANEIVRVTADCPFVDPGLVDEVVGLRRAKGVDYASNQPADPAARTFPVGLSVECFTRDALSRAWTQAAAPHEREHVTPHMYASGAGSVAILALPESYAHYRWTVDTCEDLDVVRRLDALVGDEPFSWRDVLVVAQERPDLEEINAHVDQKTYQEVDSRWGSLQAPGAQRTEG